MCRPTGDFHLPTEIISSSYNPLPLEFFDKLFFCLKISENLKIFLKKFNDELKANLTCIFLRNFMTPKNNSAHRYVLSPRTFVEIFILRKENLHDTGGTVRRIHLSWSVLLIGGTLDLKFSRIRHCAVKHV